MEIEKGNILICEFMGYIVKNGIGGFLIRYDKDGYYAGQFGPTGNKYHTDWNLLILVIKKMQDVGLKDEEVFKLLNDVYDSLLSFDIEKTWTSVVLALKEHGKNI